VPVAWTSEDLAALPPDTDGLSVRIPVPDDGDLRLIARLKHLEDLQINEPGLITDAGIRALASLPRLKTLSCSFGDVTPEGLASLAECRTLRRLSLSVGRMNDDALRAIGGLASLERFHLSGCGAATDEGIKELARLTRLKSLGLSWSNGLTGKTFDALAALRELATLDLTGMGLSTEGTAAIARIPSLRRLKLYDAGVGDDHLRALAACKRLEDLSIYHDHREPRSPTDAGVAALSSVRTLRRFTVTGAGVTAEAVGKLSASLGIVAYVR